MMAHMRAFKYPSPPETPDLGKEVARLKKRLQRERQSRVQAEKLLESKSAELFDASENLKHEAERARALTTAIESASDGVAIADANGVFHYVNSAFGKTFGLPAIALVGRSWTAVYSSKLRTHLERAALPNLARHGYWSGDIIGYSAGHYPLFLELVLSPVADGGIVFSSRDIKKRLARQREVRDLETRLNKAESEAALFTLGNAVAHDFNNLIAAISGHTLLLQSYIDDTSEAAAHAVQILEATDQAAEVVRSLDLERNNETMIIEPVELAKLIRTGIAISDSIRPPGIQVHLDLTESVTVQTNQVLLTRALINIVKNSFDAMRGRGQLDVRLASTASTPLGQDTEVFKVGRSQDDIAWVLELSDTGSGIPKDKLEKIFAPFVTTKQRMKGSGLGLLSLKALADTQTVRIEVETAEDIGTCFRLFFLHTRQSLTF